ncbi:hypothetical protein B7755_007765 [Streptomyces sp. NBS 14/10]|uniref:hypothetical protein n=1 Tax=Streptomyces sp. NBS 14/10 TaxID=1945643 RepID=UPI000B7FBEB6|nr:hypothetical protein [Streptomyces sp. NBS 14/10]KAK1178047.1 hypothetical protein B7755_007765 [Streptomyces sp. NBS 14/10]
MCRTPEPDSPDADTEENGRGTERNPARALEPGSSAKRWYLRERASWGAGLCVVSGVLDAVAALAQNEALAVVARALLAMGDRIVDAGQHRRS